MTYYNNYIGTLYENVARIGLRMKATRHKVPYYTSSPLLMRVFREEGRFSKDGPFRRLMTRSVVKIHPITLTFGPLALCSRFKERLCGGKSMSLLVRQKH